GDSWFDYPLPIPILAQSDIIAHLKRLPSMTPQVLSLAQNGETTEDMLGVKKIHDLFDQFNDPANGKFDAILFSGGGNDLVGNQFRLWLNDTKTVNDDPAKGLNAIRVAAILAVVKAGYEDLMLIRDKIAPTIPIFAHSYDFAIPSGIGVACSGLWLRPGLDDRGWSNPASARDIVKEVLLQFNHMLAGFAANPDYHFVHVQTQGTLSDDLWANELHPTPTGFAEITAKFVEALRLQFPGRI
ncbi:MAG: SGNH/GDSL hydrolase family protein, partial [Glaciimonas sp.]|nr:SGNH/GDSL hydrolase family protein [Glaciimonas sp.]